MKYLDRQVYDGTLINYTEGDICLNSKAEFAIVDFMLYIFLIKNLWEKKTPK